MNATKSSSMSQYLIVGILTVQVFLSIVLLLRVYSLEQSIVQYTQSSRTATNAESAPFVEGVSPDDDPSLGPATAPVTIVEFSDFQCPYCAQSVPILKELMSKYPDQVRLIYRDFPLETIHPDSMNASLAAECANGQGHFWEMYEMLFNNQDALDVASLEDYAKGIGLDIAKFRECMSSQRYLDEILNDMADGQSYGVRGTPTFFVSGHRLTGSSLETLEQVVEQVLSEK